MHSRKLVLACAMFGVTPRISRHERARVQRHAAAAAARIDRDLSAGGIALLTGPSGGGKSTIAGLLARRLRRRGATAIVVDPGPLIRTRRAVIDLFPGGPRRALRALAGAGLAEVPLLGRRARELSEGQRWRLALALAMDRAQRRRDSRRPCTLIADEFASGLDPAAAACVARTLRRWLRRNPPHRALCIAARCDLLAPLEADLVVIQDLAAPARFSTLRGERA